MQRVSVRGSFSKLWTTPFDRVALVQVRVLTVCGGCLVGILCLPDWTAAQEQAPAPSRSLPSRVPDSAQHHEEPQEPNAAQKTQGSQGTGEGPPASAPTTDALQKKLARDLAWAGVDLYNAKKYAAATRKFSEAYALQPVPTVGLWSARALQKQQKLIEASERYVEVMRMALKPDSPAVYAAAKQDALTESDTLQQRIPRLKLNAHPSLRPELRVTLNGSLVSAELIGSAIPLNPGKIHVLARHQGRTSTYSIILKESARRTVHINFSPLRAAAVPPSKSPAPPSPTNLDEAKDVPVASWVSLAIGGLGMITGVSYGLNAQSDDDSLQRACPQNSCPAEFAEKLDDFRTARTVSLIGYGIGVVGLAAAGVFYFTTGQETDAAIVIHPGGAALRGNF